MCVGLSVRCVRLESCEVDTFVAVREGVLGDQATTTTTTSDRTIERQADTPIDPGQREHCKVLVVVKRPRHSKLHLVIDPIYTASSGLSLFLPLCLCKLG
jgi:hypothetical protein